MGKKHYTHAGYSWLGMFPDKEEEIAYKQETLENDCKLMEETLFNLEGKVKHYHTLCQQYEKIAGKEEAPGLLKEIDTLTSEIEELSLTFSQTFNETIRITHPPKNP